MSTFQCGYIAIVGRPNVGKSTLLNHILGQKLSITSRKPQTTRHSLLGIKTTEQYQAIYVDTPGLHQKATVALNRYMNRTATSALEGVDLVLWVVDATRWTRDDEWVEQKLASTSVPIILVLNKCDKLTNKDSLLPLIQNFAKRRHFAAIMPISAKSGYHLQELEHCVAAQLPEHAAVFAADELTDKSSRFLAAELIREKIMRATGQELPYASTVEIEEFAEETRLLRIGAIIWVEKPGQKAIIIGEKGEQLKQIGTQARLDMEKLFERKVFLRLWVKIKRNWSDNERSLKSLGFD